MKTVSFTALLALLLFIHTYNILSQPHGLYSVCSGDGSTVIAVGKSGMILRSTNAGSSWSSRVISAYDLRSVYSVGSTSWAAGDNGTYAKTTDNGVSWSLGTIAGNKNLRSIFFTNANIGWISGADGVVYKTINGGNNWTLKTTGTPNVLNCIRFTSSLIGWACGAGGTVLKTINGGDDWFSAAPTANNELLSIDIKGNTLITTGVNSTVLKSTNNGSSWNSIEYKILTKSDVNSVWMFDENTHFTCGGGGFIRKSTDAGSTYAFPFNPMFGDLFAMYFYNPNTGWAVSRKTLAVITTTDGGSTWNLPAGTNVNYNISRTLLSGYLHTFGDVISVFNPFSKNVVYTLLKEKIYRSSNLGDNWANIITLPFPCTYSQFFAISPYDTNKMIALLVNPTKLYYTSNYGVNWIPSLELTSIGAGVPVEVDPNHPDTLYYGSNGPIYRSTNFGLNWTQIFASGVDKCDIEVSYGNSNNIVTASKNPALIFRSTNAGLNFTLTNYTSSNNGESPTLHTNPFNPAEIFHLFYFSNSSQDGIWRSTNYGSNWTKLYTVFAPWGITTAADDPNVIFCGLWDTAPKPAHISTNNGTSFFTTNVISSEYNANIAIFAYDRGNVLFQQTDGIYKMRVVYDVPAIGITPISSEVPERFSLSQNYPNPFNPSTVIRFTVKNTSQTRLVVYDIQGKEINSLVDEKLTAGIYEINFSAGSLPSGVYFYKLASGDYTETRKMILLK